MKHPETWLPLLRCIACHSSLEMHEAGETAPDGHLMTGALRCTQCSAVYPVTGGIPRFVPDAHAAEVKETVAAFGYQWQQANNLVQNTTLSASELFLDFVAPVSGDYVRDKVVLDGGCGQGRFTLAAHRLGAAKVVGVDLSDAVLVAFENTRHLDNVLIVQGDLLSLPVQPVFDYAFSVGVLHHTAQPRQAFISIASAVKSGGGVSAWVYGREGNDWIIHVLNPIRRKITSRIFGSLLGWIARLLAIPLYLSIKLVYQPVSRIEGLAFLRKRLFYYDYLVWLGQYCGYREQALVIYDHLTPAIAEYISHDEFQAWFQESHLEDVVITSRAGNSWRGFGKRGAFMKVAKHA